MHYGEIEGSGFEVIEPEFARCFVGHARVERLFTGCRWAEGPAWFGGGRYLLWSDLPGNRILRYDDTDGSVSVFREPSGYTNGNTVDREGRLVSCEHGHRRVTRTGHDGAITVLADRYEGKRLNSPNDVVVKSDGSVWFSDPDYGMRMNPGPEPGKVKELDGNFLFRLNAKSGALTIPSKDFDHPNGLCFSPDDKNFSSMTPAVRRKMSACSTCIPMARSPAARSSPKSPRARPTASAVTALAASGVLATAA